MQTYSTSNGRAYPLENPCKNITAKRKAGARVNWPGGWASRVRRSTRSRPYKYDPHSLAAGAARWRGCFARWAVPELFIDHWEPQQ